MTDLFDIEGAEPQQEPEEENQVLAEAVVQLGAEETVAGPEETEGPDDAHEEPEDGVTAEVENSSGEPAPAEKKAEAAKQVNVVEEDPYEFDKCLITIAMALLPNDGSPDGRSVMLGVRNHQDEPILATCRLSDLMPLPDPIQQLLEQLKADLPARSEKAMERKKQAEEAKKKTASSKTKPAAKAKKAEKPKPTSMNLFEMFDQPSQ
jgi:hypothetical protein